MTNKSFVRFDCLLVANYPIQHQQRTAIRDKPVRIYTADETHPILLVGDDNGGSVGDAEAANKLLWSQRC